MSLIFRSVKKISKKKRKTANKNRTKKCCKDPFEDNPMKFVVEDEENRPDFPSLNSVYKTELFGTPLPFRNGSGYDCMKFLKIKTKLQSIVFMNEYMNKSFEELRWEDYQCNRKGSHIFEERNYLKCLSKDHESMKWKTTLSSKKYETEPLPGISNSKFPALARSNSLDVNIGAPDKPVVQPQKIILQRPNKDIAMESKTTLVKSSKERSILTNVNKLCPLKEAEFINSSEMERKRNSPIRSSSDMNLTSRKEMVKDNLQRYFSSVYSNSSVPYEFYSQNNNYFMPCANISLAYKNKQTNRTNKNSGYLWDSMKTNPFGYNSIFDKLEPVVEKGSLYEKLFGFAHGAKTHKKCFDSIEGKYTSKNKFSKDYFWDQFSPYLQDGKAGTARCSQCVESDKCTRFKKYWLGLDVVS